MPFGVEQAPGLMGRISVIVTIATFAGPYNAEPATRNFSS
jgi:hypothetical protein